MNRQKEYVDIDEVLAELDANLMAARRIKDQESVKEYQQLIAAYRQIKKGFKKEKERLV